MNRFFIRSILRQAQDERCYRERRVSDGDVSRTIMLFFKSIMTCFRLIILSLILSLSKDARAPMSPAELTKIRDAQSMHQAVQAGMSACAGELAGVNIAMLLGGGLAGAALPYAVDAVSGAASRLKTLLTQAAGAAENTASKVVSEIEGAEALSRTGSVMEHPSVSPTGLVGGVAESTSGGTASTVASVQEQVAQALIDKIEGGLVRANLPKGLSSTVVTQRVKFAVNRFLEDMQEGITQSGRAYNTQDLIAQLQTAPGGIYTKNPLAGNSPYVIRLGEYVNTALADVTNDLSALKSLNPTYVNAQAGVQAQDIVTAMGQVQKTFKPSEVTVSPSLSVSPTKPWTISPAAAAEDLTTQLQITEPTTVTLTSGERINVVNNVATDMKNVAKARPEITGSADRVHTIFTQALDEQIKNDATLLNRLARGEPEDIAQLAKDLRAKGLDKAIKADQKVAELTSKQGTNRYVFDKITQQDIEHVLSNTRNDMINGKFGASVQSRFSHAVKEYEVQQTARVRFAQEKAELGAARVAEQEAAQLQAAQKYISSAPVLSRTGAAMGSTIGLGSSVSYSASQAGACYERVLKTLGVTVLKATTEQRPADLATRAYLLLHNTTHQPLTLTLHRAATTPVLTYPLPADQEWVVVPLEGVLNQDALISGPGITTPLRITIYRVPYVTQVLSGVITHQGTTLSLTHAQGIGTATL